MVKGGRDDRQRIFPQPWHCFFSSWARQWLAWASQRSKGKAPSTHSHHNRLAPVAHAMATEIDGSAAATATAAATDGNSSETDERALKMLAHLSTLGQYASLVCPFCGSHKSTKAGMWYHIKKRVCRKETRRAPPVKVPIVKEAKPKVQRRPAVASRRDGDSDDDDDGGDDGGSGDNSGDTDAAVPVAATPSPAKDDGKRKRVTTNRFVDEFSGVGRGTAASREPMKKKEAAKVAAASPPSTATTSSAPAASLLPLLPFIPGLEPDEFGALDGANHAVARLADTLLREGSGRAARPAPAPIDDQPDDATEWATAVASMRSGEPEAAAAGGGDEEREAAAAAMDVGTAFRVFAQYRDAAADAAATSAPDAPQPLSGLLAEEAYRIFTAADAAAPSASAAVAAKAGASTFFSSRAAASMLSAVPSARSLPPVQPIQGVSCRVGGPGCAAWAMDVTLESDERQAASGVAAWVAVAAQHGSSSTNVIQLWTVSLPPFTSPGFFRRPSAALACYFASEGGTVVDMEWSPVLDTEDGRLGVLAVLTRDGVVRVYAVPRPAHPPTTSPSSTSSAGASPSTAMLLVPHVVIPSPGTLRPDLIDATGAEPSVPFASAAHALCIRWSGSGSPRLAIGRANGDVSLVDFSCCGAYEGGGTPPPPGGDGGAGASAASVPSAAPSSFGALRGARDEAVLSSSYLADAHGGDGCSTPALLGLPDGVTIPPGVPVLFATATATFRSAPGDNGSAPWPSDDGRAVRSLAWSPTHPHLLVAAHRDGSWAVWDATLPVGTPSPFPHPPPPQRRVASFEDVAAGVCGGGGGTAASSGARFASLSTSVPLVQSVTSSMPSEWIGNMTPAAAEITTDSAAAAAAAGGGRDLGRRRGCPLLDRACSVEWSPDGLGLLIGSEGGALFYMPLVEQPAATSTTAAPTVMAAEDVPLRGGAKAAAVASAAVRRRGPEFCEAAGCDCTRRATLVRGSTSPSPPSPVGAAAALWALAALPVPLPPPALTPPTPFRRRGGPLDASATQVAAADGVAGPPNFERLPLGLVAFAGGDGSAYLMPWLHPVESAALLAMMRQKEERAPPLERGAGAVWDSRRFACMLLPPRPPATASHNSSVSSSSGSTTLRGGVSPAASSFHVGAPVAPHAQLRIRLAYMELPMMDAPSSEAAPAPAPTPSSAAGKRQQYAQMQQLAPRPLVMALVCGADGVLTATFLDVGAEFAPRPVWERRVTRSLGLGGRRGGEGGAASSGGGVLR